MPTRTTTSLSPIPERSPGAAIGQRAGVEGAFDNPGPSRSA